MIDSTGRKVCSDISYNNDQIFIAIYFLEMVLQEIVGYRSIGQTVVGIVLKSQNLMGPTEKYLCGLV